MNKAYTITHRPGFLSDFFFFFFSLTFVEKQSDILLPCAHYLQMDTVQLSSGTEKSRVLVVQKSNIQLATGALKLCGAVFCFVARGAMGS